MIHYMIDHVMRHIGQALKYSSIIYIRSRMSDRLVESGALNGIAAASCLSCYWAYKTSHTRNIKYMLLGFATVNLALLVVKYLPSVNAIWYFMDPH